MLTISCPVPTKLKEVCVSMVYILSNPRNFPMLLSPTSSTYNQWILYNPPYVSSFLDSNV